MRNNNIWLGVFLGIGIGLVLSSGFYMIYPVQTSSNRPGYIKSEARKLGMIDPTEYIDKKQIAKNSTSNYKNTITVEIPSNATDKEVASILKQKNLIESEEAFLKKITQNKLKTGKFEFTINDSIEDIIQKIIVE